MGNKKLLLVIASLFITQICLANIVVPIHLTSNDKIIGSVTLKDSPKGLVLIPNLHGLPPGPHGFHLHEHDTCGEHGNAAGGHFDPMKTGKHLGPYNPKGHMGDLPVLNVGPDGRAVQRVVAPRLKIRDVRGHSLMIHEGGDNYSDTPKKLGGGGSRIACGVIE